MLRWTIIHNFSRWNDPQSNILLTGSAQTRAGDHVSKSWHIYTEWPKENAWQYFRVLTRSIEWNFDNFNNIYQEKHTEQDFWVIQICIPQACTHQAAAFPAPDIHSPGVHCDFLPPGEFLTLGSVPGCGFCCWVRIHSFTHLSQASTDKTMALRIMYYSLLCRSGQHHLKHTKFVGNIIKFYSAPGLQSYLGN